MGNFIDLLIASQAVIGDADRLWLGEWRVCGCGGGGGGGANTTCNEYMTRHK